ncbi:MAG TPA: hypothetical protein VMS37_00945 [Verrucomicrobiae bacterium]|nr:hypothetical protein [Verrucomicrobiae bacterium]
MANTRQIVVVEDVFVRAFLRTALERHGHRVTCAGPVAAIDLLKLGQIGLLITNTPEVFAEFGASVPLIYVAAFPDPSAAAAFTRWRPLRKPFPTSELLSLVAEFLPQ